MYRLFLKGLEACGKGNWKNIARYYVVTRTPSQVASHAQKYFHHLKMKEMKERKRKSIHDVTSYKEDLDTLHSRDLAKNNIEPQSLVPAICHTHSE